MRLRVVRLFFLAYRVFLSPALHLLSGAMQGCRFIPSCSQYGEEAVQSYGLIRGIWLTFKRLLRCHPFSKSQYDPVPPLENWRKDEIQEFVRDTHSLRETTQSKPALTTLDSRSRSRIKFICPPNGGNQLVEESHECSSHPSFPARTRKIRSLFQKLKLYKNQV